MATVIDNIGTALANPRLLYKYFCYRVPQLFGKAAKVPLPLAGFVTARTFSEYLSVYCLFPTEGEVNFVNRLDPREAAIIDVGANVGAWSVMLGKRHRNVKLISFEPSPSVHTCLIRNLALNGLGGVVCEQLAVSSEEGEVQFQEPRNASVFSRMLPSTQDNRGGRFSDCTLTNVRTMRLDSYCEMNGIQRIGFIKIDVEGAEPLVLRGMARLLSEHRVDQIYLEVDPDNLGSMGFTVEDIAQALEPYGYRFYRLQSDGQPGEQVELREIHSGNYLSLPEKAVVGA